MSATKTKTANKTATRKPAKRAAKKATRKTAARKTAAARKEAATAKSAPKKPSNLLGGLTPAERHHLAQLVDRGKAKALGDITASDENIKVHFYVQDGKDEAGHINGAFTVALLAIGGELKGVGVAKRNPKLDKWSTEIGRKVALARAAMGEARLQ